MTTTNQNPCFFEYEAKTGILANFAKNEFPTNLYGFQNGTLVFAEKKSTLLGYVAKGKTIILVDDDTYVLKTGMYFSIPLSNFKKISIVGGEGFIAERIDYIGLFLIGGPTEKVGRLKYIDGCTDSLLIPPVKLGDPCFNLLVFPANTNQTSHTHPSLRLGMVVKGSGECVTPHGNIKLEVGKIFIIPTEKEHSFKTSKEEMTVIAYHPDSDFGPTDEDHPMINKTIVDGISANTLTNIQTK